MYSAAEIIRRAHDCIGKKRSDFDEKMFSGHKVMYVEESDLHQNTDDEDVPQLIFNVDKDGKITDYKL